ncbi:hypothetical protein [Frondihabitans peucedani]|uniref:hypothetical protein n=1 Tax=Frondihabitans peucedani TaxID=598626 RepID=UPI0031DFC432
MNVGRRRRIDFRRATGPSSVLSHREEETTMPRCFTGMCRPDGTSARLETGRAAEARLVAGRS